MKKEEAKQVLEVAAILHKAAAALEGLATQDGSIVQVGVLLAEISDCAKDSVKVIAINQVKKMLTGTEKCDCPACRMAEATAN